MFVLSCYMYMTGVVNKAGLADSSGAPEVTPGFLVEFVLSVLLSFMCNGFVICVS